MCECTRNRSVTLARDTYTDDRLDRFEVEAQNRWVELGGHPEDVQLAVERRELALGRPAVPAEVAGTPVGRALPAPGEMNNGDSLAGTARPT